MHTQNVVTLVLAIRTVVYTGSVSGTDGILERIVSVVWVQPEISNSFNFCRCSSEDVQGTCGQRAGICHGDHFF